MWILIYVNKIGEINFLDLEMLVFWIEKEKKEFKEIYDWLNEMKLKRINS